MMQLVALKCPTCGQNLKPKSNETVVVSCDNCKTVVSLHQSGVKAIEVQYAAPTSNDVEAWLPMWVYTGRVTILRRKSQGSSKGADKAAAQMWNSDRRLYAPAWSENIQKARQIGSMLVARQPLFEAIEPTTEMVMQEATITPKDGIKLLDFIILSLEADRKDKLEDLQFEIRPTGYKLWAIPARRTRSNWEFPARFQAT